MSDLRHGIITHLDFGKTQLNFAVWCATSACGVSAQHLNNKSHAMVKSVYGFHAYYHIKKVRQRLQILLPSE